MNDITVTRQGHDRSRFHRYILSDHTFLFSLCIHLKANVSHIFVLNVGCRLLDSVVSGPSTSSLFEDTPEVKHVLEDSVCHDLVAKAHRMVPKSDFQPCSDTSPRPTGVQNLVPLEGLTVLGGPRSTIRAELCWSTSLRSWNLVPHLCKPC